MHSLKSFFFLSLLLLCGAVSSAAHSEDESISLDERVRLRVEKAKLDGLEGWKKITFICGPASGEKRDGAKSQLRLICDETEANLKTLADLSQTDVAIVKNWVQMGEFAALTGGLQLEVEIIFSNCDSSYCAMAGQVVAEFDYESLIENGSARIFEQSGRPTHPTRTARPATAVFWRSGIFLISGSDNNEFTTGSVSTIDKYLKDFFAIYTKARRRTKSR